MAFKRRLVVSHCELFHMWLSCLDLIVKCIGEETKYESIRLLFDGLQQPVLNKQVREVVGVGVAAEQRDVWFITCVGHYTTSSPSLK